MPAYEETEWPDARLVEAIRREPPNERALDALIQRYWSMLYGRCLLLTQDDEGARDLAQESWQRLLRARRTLDDGGNVRGYLIAVATNLWRDRSRAERRAGPFAERRLASLHEMKSGAEGSDAVSLADAVPDPRALDFEGRVVLAADLDRALAALSPRLRDVLLARHLDGESAAEIGRRYGRTEQSVTGWLRQAIAQVRQALGADYEAPGERPPLRSRPETRESPPLGG